MAKTPMGLMVRAWDKELKTSPWNMRSRKHRKACARDFASISIETDNDVLDAVEAEFRVQEELADWGQ